MASASKSRVNAAELPAPSPEDIQRAVASLNLKCPIPSTCKRLSCQRRGNRPALFSPRLRSFPILRRRWQCAFCLDMQPVAVPPPAVLAHAESVARLQVWGARGGGGGGEVADGFRCFPM
jgi:hypothetical protein